MNTIFEKYKAWSYLDPKPSILYSEYHDEYLVMWNGILVTYSAACALMGLAVLELHISDYQKSLIFADTRRLLFKDIFPQFLSGNEFSNYQQYWGYVCKCLYETAKTLRKTHSKRECMESLDVSRCNHVDIYEKIG